MAKDITNFFIKIDVVDTTFSVRVDLPFNTTSFSIFEETTNTTDIIEYSFSGKEDEIHGEINPKFFRGIFFDNRVTNRIWFRRQTAGSSVTIRIEAWTNV